MIVGIPKEEGFEERRVGLSPAGVRELSDMDIKVYIERKAGEGAGFSEEMYKEAGGEVVYSKEEIYKRADIVVKVGAPNRNEWDMLREKQTLFAFLHLAVASKELLGSLIEKKITAIGYEIIQKDDGELPILKSMSQIAGKMALQIAGRLLEGRGSGRLGVLIGGLPGIPPVEVVILGGGTLGYCAAETFSGVGANVYVVDKDIKKLEEIDRSLKRVVTLISSQQNIEKLCKFCDTLISCVLVPGATAPILVTKEMVRRMKKGAVIIDFSIDQGGCVETSRLTPTGEPYIEEGVIHFCMPNLPAWVPRTSSYVLTNSIIPYLKIIGEKGIKETLRTVKEIGRGSYTFDGYITNPNIVHTGFPYSPLERIL
jgi:alanine dehydrogenase